MSSCKSWLSTSLIKVKFIFEIFLEMIRFKCEFIITWSSTSSSVLMNDMTFYDCENSNTDDAHWIFTILYVMMNNWSSENDVKLVCVWVKDVLIFLTCVSVQSVFCCKAFIELQWLKCWKFDLFQSHWT